MTDDESDELATLRVLAAIHGTDLLELTDRSMAEVRPRAEQVAEYREVRRRTAEV